MPPTMFQTRAPWMLSRRSGGFKPSVIRDLLRCNDAPEMISMAGGLPAPHGFPVDALAAAADRIFTREGAAALQYGPSDGYAPLRAAIAQRLPWAVDPNQVLITTGSQQGLDLLGKVLIDSGSRVLVESPTYPGALQAFAPMEPSVYSVPFDDQGVVPDALAALRGTGGDKARLLYVQPTFQNPTGRTLGEDRRTRLVEQAAALHIPLVEDDPYGELWLEAPPPLALTARNPEGCVYMGSFSKVLAPGLRVGFIVAPKPVYSRLLLAKQAADLHTPGMCQRLVYELLSNGTLDSHIPTIRALYRHQRDTMVAALNRHLAPLGAQWQTPQGGLFMWVQLPPGMHAANLLPLALARNVAFVPGTAFEATEPCTRMLRLSYATATPDQIDTGIAALAQAMQACRSGRQKIHDETTGGSTARLMEAVPGVEM